MLTVDKRRCSTSMFLDYRYRFLFKYTHNLKHYHCHSLKPDLFANPYGVRVIFVNGPRLFWCFLNKFIQQ